MKIGLDFDGVVHDHLHPVEGKRMGPPIEGAFDGVRSLIRHGHEVVLFTVRGDAPHVRAWLRYFDFPPLRITDIKESFDIILDDHAMHFTDWDTAREHLGAGLSRTGL